MCDSHEDSTKTDDLVFFGAWWLWNNGWITGDELLAKAYPSASATEAVQGQ